jgi:hypothetical protein
MSSPMEPDDLTPRIRVMQIIAGAIALGALFFLGIVIALRLAGRAPQPPKTPMLTYVAIVFTVMVLLPFTIVPDRVIVSGRKQIARGDRQARAAGEETARLATLYQISMIIRLALLEGAALFQIIIFHLEGRQLSLVLALILAVGMVLLFPTQTRVESWIDKQQEKLEEERWT